MAQKKKKILIAGGGLAGLAAAYRLSEKNDFEIVIVEKEGNIGGLAGTIDIDGAKADFGSHRIFTEIPEIKDFLLSFAKDILHPVVRESHIYLKNQYLDYPPTPKDFLKKLGFFMMMKFAASKLFASLSIPADFSKIPDYETAMRHAFGNAVYEFLLKPFTEKTWKIPANNLHSEVARVRISAGNFKKLVASMFLKSKENDTGLKSFLYPKGGMASLVGLFQETLKERGVKIEKNAELVKIIEYSKESIKAEIIQGGIRRQLDCNTLISTIPITSLINMLLEINPDGIMKNVARRYKFLSLKLIYFLLAEERISRDNWTYYPEKDIVFHRGYESKNFDEGMCPKDKTLLALEISGYKGSEFWNEADEITVNKTIADAVKIKLFDPEKIIKTKVLKLPYAYPVYALDYQENLKISFDYLKNFPRILTTGRQGLFNHNNADHSIYMGFEAADAVLEDISEPAKKWFPRLEKFKNFRIVD